MGSERQIRSTSGRRRIGRHLESQLLIPRQPFWLRLAARPETASMALDRMSRNVLQQ